MLQQPLGIHRERIGRILMARPSMCELRSEAGQDLVEYLLLLTLIAVALLAVLTGLGHELDAFYQRIVANLDALI